MNNQSIAGGTHNPRSVCCACPKAVIAGSKGIPQHPQQSVPCIPSVINTIILQKVLLPKSAEMSSEKQKQNQYLECNVMLERTASGFALCSENLGGPCGSSSLRWIGKADVDGKSQTARIAPNRRIEG
jgi:hypothetical protein